MASISQLVGWDPQRPSPQPALTQLDRLSPEAFPTFAPAAHDLGSDLRTAYAIAQAQTADRERESDRTFLERAAEFVELHDQVEASTELLADLASFLATFQGDLSAVSGHIAELQNRSKSIEARLKARKAVERSLHPFLSSITISPALITTILDTDVDDNWIRAVRELDAKLGAIRGGARVDRRRTLDDAAEALRVAASSKILHHLVSLLKPYTLSLASPLSTLHATLLARKPLFDFLRRHAARQAHEVQKAYVQTARWYLETGFRRYIRALEKIRTAQAATAGGMGEPIGSVAGVADALALLQQRKSPNPAGRTARAGPTPTSIALENAQTGGESAPDIIPAHAANDRSSHPPPPPEALFRSASLVLADNAAAEYTFLAAFFGQHSTLDASSSSAPGPPGVRRSATQGSLRSAAGGSDSARTTSGAVNQERDERMQRAVVDALWKSVLEPALEYTRNFLHALLDPVLPPPIALLSMLRLTEVLSGAAAAAVLSPSSPLPQSAPFPPCPPLAAHLGGVRLSLLQGFARAMSTQVDSLRRINGSVATGVGAGGGGVVGGLLARATAGGRSGSTGTAVKDSVVTVVVGRYCELFNAAVALLGSPDVGGGPEAHGEGEDKGEGEGPREDGRARAADRDERLPEMGVGVQAAQDENTVFSALLRLRQELDKLIAFQASKISDRGKAQAFLRAQCDELLQGLSAGRPSHARTQAEVAHWRETARRAA